MANKVTWKAFAKKVPRINHVLPFKHQTASVIDLFYRYNSFVHWYCTVLQLYSKDSSLTNNLEGILNQDMHQMRGWNLRSLEYIVKKCCENAVVKKMLVRIMWIKVD